MVDYLEGFGSETVKARLVSGGAEAVLAVRQRPGYFQEAVWLGPQEVMLLGSEAVYRDDGQPLCLEDGESGMRCFFKMTVDWFDLATGKSRRYVSEKHGYGNDPYNASIREIWVASLGDADKARYGVPGSFDQEVVTGRIVRIEGERGLVVESEEGAPGTVIELARGAAVFDENGEQTGLEYLRRGLSAQFVGVRDDGLGLVATSAGVIEAPPVIVYSPEPDSSVEGLYLRGLAAQDTDELVVRLRNRRTGRLIVDEVLEPAVEDGGRWGFFSLDADLTGLAESGDAMVLAVYDADDIDRGLTLELVYRLVDLEE